MLSVSVCVRFFSPRRDFGTAVESLLHFAFVLKRMANQLPLFSCCCSAILLLLFSGLRKVQNLSVHVTEAWICRVEKFSKVLWTEETKIPENKKTLC